MSYNFDPVLGLRSVVPSTALIGQAVAMRIMQIGKGGIFFI